MHRHLRSPSRDQTLPSSKANHARLRSTPSRCRHLIQTPAHPRNLQSCRSSNGAIGSSIRCTSPMPRMTFPASMISTSAFNRSELDLFRPGKQFAMTDQAFYLVGLEQPGNAARQLPNNTWHVVSASRRYPVRSFTRLDAVFLELMLALDETTLMIPASLSMECIQH